MSKLSRILAPDTLVVVFCLLAALGIAFLVAAMLMGEPIFATIGEILLAPLLLGALLIIVVVYPILIYLNLKDKRNK